MPRVAAAAAAERPQVAGDDDWISDESSFYGDDETKDGLEQTLAAASRADSFWQVQSSLPASIAYANRADRVSDSKGNTTLHWPMDGNESARQSGESVSEFITRRPPSRSNIWDHGDWLWVTNPHVAPTNPSDHEALLASGKALLDSFLAFKASLEEQGKSSSVVGRKLSPRRIALVEDLKEAAVTAKCLSGKWMLFVPESKIDQVWSTVAHAIADNQLGSAAKVATASANCEAGVRLVCIYTDDFTNLDDVKRVLNGLVKLGLVEPHSNGIYYKCDAYTHLGIDSKNEYGIKASLYASKHMLAGISKKN